MGDIKRKRKLFTRPKQLFDKERIDEENIIVRKYGLKNKREIWKAKSEVSRLRKRAKSLIGKDVKLQQAFFEKINKMGIVVNDISDILGLTENDLLNRRLQTVVFKKGFCNTPKQARQLIVHKHVFVDDKVVNIPSFLVTKGLEEKIKIKPTKFKEERVEEKVEEKLEEEVEEDGKE